MNRISFLPRFLPLALAAGILSGCASATKPQAMTVVAPAAVTHKSDASVSVEVTGGRETSAAGASQISNEDYATAIRSTIESSGLFAGIADTDAADYAISVSLVRLEQPVFGLSMTATLESNWTLKRRSDGSVVWQKAILAKHTATTGDAFVGTTRLRMATEGAARKTIEEAVAAIAALKLE